MFSATANEYNSILWLKLSFSVSRFNNVHDNNISRSSLLGNQALRKSTCFLVHCGSTGSPIHQRYFFKSFFYYSLFTEKYMRKICPNIYLSFVILALFPSLLFEGELIQNSVIKHRKLFQHFKNHLRFIILIKCKGYYHI